MISELPLKAMSNAQKLIAMEQLWGDLCQDKEINSPSWHKQVLAQREQTIAMGKSHFTDWKTAKNEMRAMVK